MIIIIMLVISPTLLNTELLHIITDHIKPLDNKQTLRTILVNMPCQVKS